MIKFRFQALLAGMLCCMGLAGAQVPLAGKIAYSSLPSPDGGRHWVSLGWNVRLLQEKSGWACTLSSGAMVELVPNHKLRQDIPWQDQSYKYDTAGEFGSVAQIWIRSSPVGWHDTIEQARAGPPCAIPAR